MTALRIKLLVLAACIPLLAYSQTYFPETNWNFGSIKEADGAVCHVFTLVNPTSTPVQLTASPSCTCIMAQLPAEAVAPGKAVDIPVFYSPSGAVGPTHRTVEIFDGKGRSLGVLSTDADVTPADRSIAERYHTVLAPCLYANMSTVPFGYMAPGQTLSKVIFLANSSDETMFLEFGYAGSGLLEVQCPPVIGPGKEVAALLTYRMPPERNFVSRYDTLTVRPEGARANARIYTSAICLTKAEDNGKAPALRVFPGTGKLKDRLLGKARSGSVSVFNDGKGDLLIQGVEAPDGTGFSLGKGSVIAPGKSVKAELTAPRGTGPVTVRIFTNDPVRPYKDIIFNNQ